MNDHLSHFLLVLESEAEAYWCFSYFLKEFHTDFMEDGMVRKIDLLEMLLRKTDPDLYEYIKSSEIENLTFCHKWLILLFKREFDLEDGLRIFEIISSHHIEMNSIEAQQVREKGRIIDVKNDCLDFQNDEIINAELKFDLFLCLTLLIENRQEIFMCVDTMDIITCSKS
ncbi:TBC1 domain family member 25 [Nymphon striatum]|nr:TBC1 domain family member 25 [Nymphon striatum]